MQFEVKVVYDGRVDDGVGDSPFQRNRKHSQLIEADTLTEAIEKTKQVIEIIRKENVGDLNEDDYLRLKPGPIKATLFAPVWEGVFEHAVPEIKREAKEAKLTENRPQLV